jgi:hypothetical protein
MLTQSLINSFHLMWDNYPEFAILLHKDKVIVSVNKEGEKLGLVVGAKCESCLPAEVHRECKVGEVIKTHRWARRIRQDENEGVIHFWVPIDGYDDYLIHFQVGANINFLCLKNISPQEKN